MADEKLDFNDVLKLLDDTGFPWLSDEVRQLRFSRSDPLVSDKEVAISRRTYNARGGESPFETITTPILEEMAPISNEDCLNFVVARIEALVDQLEQARQDAAEIGIERVQLGLVFEENTRYEDVTEALRLLLADLRIGASQ